MAQRIKHDSSAGRRRWRVIAGAAALLCIGISGGVALGLRGASVGSSAGAQQLCGACSGLPEQTMATRGMVFVAGASFRIGSDRHFPEERPQRVVRVDGFWIDRHDSGRRISVSEQFSEKGKTANDP